MSLPNSAQRVLAQLFPTPSRASLDESSTATILSLLSASGLVDDSVPHVANVVSAIRTYCPDGAAREVALMQLATALRKEAQQ
jgi:hypothetical protein